MPPLLEQYYFSIKEKQNIQDFVENGGTFIVFGSGWGPDMHDYCFLHLFWFFFLFFQKKQPF